MNNLRKVKENTILGAIFDQNPKKGIKKGMQKSISKKYRKLMPKVIKNDTKMDTKINNFQTFLKKAEMLETIFYIENVILDI